MSPRDHLYPFLAACLGIALFAVMDGFMKLLSIAFGAYSAMLWRTLAGSAMGAVAYGAQRGRWPEAAALRMHIKRGAVVMVMALCFFWGIARVPMAEAIGLSFIAPLIALYLAAVLLKEQVRREAIIASLLGLAGVGVILAGKFGASAYHEDTALGVAAIFVSALFYAWNLILQRQQALMAKPTEIALFQNLSIAAMLLVAAPFLAVWPTAEQWLWVLSSAALAFISQMLLSWAYARAEAQHLLPVEYTAFIWASITGYVMFGEAVTVATLAGTVLIVVGCWIATRGRDTPP